MSAAPITALPRTFQSLGAPTHAGTLTGELAGTIGFLVADVRGRIVGHVDGPMYGSMCDTPDAVSIRFGFLGRRRLVVPVSSIADIDDATRVISLRTERRELLTFL
jgi:hypothetical protein